jgi:predicted  nucleic acid-binding Zn-ribbon protein
MSHPAPGIPNELLQQLHAANERFHHSRRELERWMDASEYRHQERVTKAEANLHDAERDVQAIEERIKKLLEQKSAAAGKEN